MKNFLIFVLALSLAFSQNKKNHSFKGIIVDEDNLEAVSMAEIRFSDLSKWQVSDSKGAFEFERIPVGRHEIHITHVAYHHFHTQIDVSDKDSLYVISLHRSHYQSDEVLVEAEKEKKEFLNQADLSLGEEKLRDNLSSTIAEVLKSESGISTRSMGSAPARPVIRGFGGDRLLVLEDAASAGDMSATAADHAVAIDPLSADKIEVIRGPKAFLFGSNPIGGVVNVQRHLVPTQKIKKITASSAFQGMSVSNAYAFGSNVQVPFSDFVFRLDGSHRKADEINTPIGQIKNTFLKTTSIGTGISYLKNWGLVGTSFSYYKSDYGVPADEFGRHAVRIDLKRTHVKNRFIYDFYGELLQSIDFKHSYSRYEHREIENAGFVGAGFGIIEQNLDVNLKLSEKRYLKKSQFSLIANYRDFGTFGRTNMPRSSEYRFAFAFYNEFELTKKLDLNLSIRIDNKAMRVDESDKIRKSIWIDRDFANFSGGLSALYHHSKNWVSGLRLLKSFRPPAIEELYSDGPHYAAHNYEIGNEKLDSENAISLESFLSYQSQYFSSELKVYTNEFDQYIYAVGTGQESSQISSLEIYQYQGNAARIYGFEWNSDFNLSQNLKQGLELSYVRGELTEQKKNLPFIPPFRLKWYSSWQINNDFKLKNNIIFSAAQENITRFETRTGEYTVFDSSLEYQIFSANSIHSFSLSIENLFNREYYDHLNRIKKVFPEASRNIKLLYKVYF